MSELVTRNDLDKALDHAVTTLRGEMVAMEERLSDKMRQWASEIAQEVANVMVEQLRSQVSVVDEKYQDLPSQYAALREDFDAHAADAHLHRHRPAP